MPHLLVDAPAIHRGIAHKLNLAPAGNKFTSRFIEPGLVSYIDCGEKGYELLRKETIDAAMDSFIGKALCCRHVTKLNAPVPADRVRGTVLAVEYDAASGWYVAKGELAPDADDARREIMNGYDVSCAYTVTAYGPGGKYHAIPYIKEITGIEFHHLAIEPSGRYEAADIKLNSKGKPAMFKLWKIIRAKLNGAAEETVTKTEDQIDGLTLIETANGVETPIKDLVERFNAQPTIKETDTIEVGGKPVTVATLIASHTKLNADAEADAKKKKDEDDAAKDAEAAEKKNAAAPAAVKPGVRAFQVLAAAAANQPVEKLNGFESCGDVKEQMERAKKAGY